MLSPRATCPESVITRANFPVASRIIKDSIIIFGAAGEEILSDTPHGQVEPVQHRPDPDHVGKLLSLSLIHI